MTIRCFRWDDAGAPPLGAASSLSVILEKCLVDGYGTQAGLGWGKIKSPSGKVIAFQPQARAASRPWLAFDDRCLSSMYGTDLRGAAPMALFDVLTGFNDDGTSGSGSVNAVPFSSTTYLCYRRNDSVVLPWLLVADSEADYFYLLLPMAGNSSNGGVAGNVDNMKTSINRRGVVFHVAVFGSVPGSMITSDSGAFLWPGQVATAGNSAYGYPEYASSNVQLPLAGSSQDIYKFYKNGSGSMPPSKVRFSNSPFFGDRALGPVLPLFTTPNGFVNRLVLVPADIRLYCTDSKVFRGRLGGLVCSLNDRGAWRYGVDNCFSPLLQSIGGTPRQLLPVLTSNTAIPDGMSANGVSNDVNYLFFDLTGPW